MSKSVKRKYVKISDTILDEIVERMYTGEMLRVICREPEMPTDQAIRVARSKNQELDQRIVNAMISSRQPALDDAVLTLKEAESRDDILRAKELVRHYEWEAEKLLPLYRTVQKHEVEHTGPMVIGWDDKSSCPKCGHNMQDVTPEISSPDCLIPATKERQYTDIPKQGVG
jgi:hypothetical protein